MISQIFESELETLQYSKIWNKQMNETNIFFLNYLNIQVLKLLV